MKQTTASRLGAEHIDTHIEVVYGDNTFRLGPISMVIHTRGKTSIRVGSKDTTLVHEQEIKAVDFR